ncbi:hypothetical protein HMPREF9278_1032 [Mobiluncus mulieris FB024-16]|nr:hypothetical protein HMPREF9278_1032 [Mobiluncus mulieris FB024-16]
MQKVSVIMKLISRFMRCHPGTIARIPEWHLMKKRKNERRGREYP